MKENLLKCEKVSWANATFGGSMTNPCMVAIGGLIKATNCCCRCSPKPFVHTPSPEV